eukprot:3280591-Pyramimonas_sp.AAC.3
MPVVTCPGGSNIDMSGSHARVTALSNIYAAVGVAYTGNARVLLCEVTPYCDAGLKRSVKAPHL